MSSYQEAPHYAGSFSLPLIPSPYTPPKYLPQPSTPSSRTPSVHVLPLVCKNKCHYRVRQKAKLYLCEFLIFSFSVIFVFSFSLPVLEVCLDRNECLEGKYCYIGDTKMYDMFYCSP